METVIEWLNSTGRAFVGFSGPMLIQSSAVILLLLAVDLVLHRRVRAVFRYGLWMLVLVKLLLPPTLCAPTGFAYWLGDSIPVVTNGPAVQPARAADPVLSRPAPSILQAPTTTNPHEDVAAPAMTAPATNEPRPTAAPPLTWQAVVLLAWLGGVTVLSLLLIQRLLFVRSLIAQSQPAHGSLVDILDACRRQMRMGDRMSIKLSPNAASPSVCGLIRPVILMPQGLPYQLTAQHLRAILLHELAHIKRGDLWVSLLQTALQIFYFYNPLLWLANALIRRVREQAVDEMVLVALGESAPDYPDTLLHVSKLSFARPALSLRLIGVVESKHTLKARIRHMVTRPFPKSAKLGLLSLIALILTAAVLLPMAAAKNEDQVKQVTYKVTLPDCGVWVADIHGNDLPIFDLAGNDLITFLNVKNEHELMQISEHSDEGDILYYYNRQRKYPQITFLRGTRFEDESSSDKSEMRILTPMEIPWSDTVITRDNNKFRVRILTADEHGCEIEYQPITGALQRLTSRRPVRELTSSESGASDNSTGQKTLSNSLKFEIRRSKPAKEIVTNVIPENLDHRHIATLSNGVTVELVGVCEHPSEGKQWWRPDGTALNIAPFERSDVVISQQAGRQAFDTAIRIEGVKHEPGFEYVIPVAQSSGCDSTFMGGNGRLYNIAFDAPEKLKNTEVQLGVGSSKWITLSTIKADFQRVSAESGKQGGIVWTQPTEINGQTVLFVTYSGKNKNVQIVAIGKNNEEYGPDSNDICGVSEFETIRAEFFMPLSKIKEFQFQTRPYEWVTFKNVSLKPNSRTDVQIEVEKSPAPMVTEGMALKNISGHVEGEEGRGEMVLGLRCRLRPLKSEWQAKETPSLILDLKNQGEKELSFVRMMQAHCQIEVDGKWYGWSESLQIDNPVWRLKPGDELYDAIEIKLADSWALPKDVNEPKFAPGRAEKWGDRLRLLPGKHKVRVSFVPDEWREGSEITTYATSNPVQIEVEKSPGQTINPGNDATKNEPAAIVTEEGSWGEPKEGVQIRLRAIKNQWPEGETLDLPFAFDMRNRGNKTFKLWIDGIIDWTLEVDGQYYALNSSMHFTDRPIQLKPGQVLVGNRIPFRLGNEEKTFWLNKDGQSLVFTPGRHIVKALVTTLGPLITTRITVESNPVEIEITKQAETSKSPAQPTDANNDAPKNEPPAAENKPEQLENFTVFGQVKDPAGKGMPGVEISANCGAGTLHRTGKTLTDADGRYTLHFGPGMMVLDNLTKKSGAGFQAATIYAFKNGFYETGLCRQGNLGMAENARVAVEYPNHQYQGIVLPDKPYEVDFVMVPAAIIQGQVLDKSGKPVINSRLCLSGNDLYPSTNVLNNIEPDQEGRFSISSIPLRPFWFEMENCKTDPLNIDQPAVYEVKLTYDNSQSKPALTYLLVEVKNIQERTKMEKTPDSSPERISGHRLAPVELKKPDLSSDGFDMKSVQDWVERLKGLQGPRGHQNTAFGLGPQLTGQNSDFALAVVRSVWPELTDSGVKTGLLKAFQFAKHPRVLQVLNLGVTDPDTEVQRYALTYVKEYSLEQFYGNSSEYQAWYAQHKDMPLEQVKKDAIRNNKSKVAEKLDELLTLFKKGDSLDKLQYPAREIAEYQDPQAIPVFIGMIDADNSYNSIYGIGYFCLGKITGVKYSPYHDGAWWRRWWEKNKIQYDPDVRNIAIPDLPKTESGKKHQPFPESMDTLQGKLDWMLKKFNEKDYRSLSDIAQDIAEHNDPSAIPVMIGVIAAHNEYDTVYGVGYFGLSKLTGVEYSPYHDGAWWIKWWEENKGRFPENVQRMPIPDLKIEKEKSSDPTINPGNDAKINKPAAGQEGKNRTTDEESVVGWIMDGRGKPIAGASAAMITDQVGVELDNGKLLPQNKNQDPQVKIIQTDADGMFDFGANPKGAFSIVAADTTGGFAKITSAVFFDNRAIQLKPWGRIEGVRKAKVKIKKDSSIVLSELPYQNQLTIRSWGSCVDDNCFIFERVPEGWYEVGYLVPTGKGRWSTTSRTPVEVKAGTTTQMSIGGEGRMVKGKFVAPAGYVEKVDFSMGVRSLVRARPATLRPDALRKENIKSENFINEWNQYHHDPNWRYYAFNIDKDGAFQINDVIGGAYQLHVTLEKGNDRHNGPPEETAFFDREIEIPGDSVAGDNPPVDLGELVLDITKTKDSAK